MRYPPQSIGGAIEGLTDRVRLYREFHMLTKEDLKAKRLKAMAVIGDQMQANSDMFDRVIAMGEKVATARTAAETAQTAALQAQVADLTEMADDLETLGNAAGAAAGTSTTSGTDTTTPSGKISAGPALQALNAAQPNPPVKTLDGWSKADAYEGTHPAS